MARSKDLQGLIDALNAIPVQARKAIDPALDKGADEMVARMRHLAPDDPKTSGGDLKSKIRKVRGPVPLAVRVQAIDENERGEDVAMFQEYGVLHDTNGEHRAANPFFWVSVNSLKKRVRRRVDRAISKAISDAWRKA